MVNKKLDKKLIQTELQELIIQIMNLLGIMLIGSFSLVGLFTFNLRYNIDTFSNIFVSSITIIFLFLMNVCDEM